MNKIRFLAFVLTIGTLLLSACSAAATTATPAPNTTSGGSKAEAMPVAFVGIIDRMDGNQWVISGTTVTVDVSIVRDGPFNVGDQVKVEGFVNPDGSFTVSRVENPTPQETATLPALDDNSNEAISNANTNDANINDDGNVNSNDDNSNSSNSNDDNGGNSNDDNGNDDNGGNSNDDNGNDDHGGNSNDDNGNDDHGGNSNDDDGDDDNGGGGNGNDDD